MPHFLAPERTEDWHEDVSPETRGPGAGARRDAHHRRLFPSIKGTEDIAVIETADGAIIVDTFTTTATVTGINADKREVMLVAPDGRRATYKAGPDMVNFSQLQVGDQVTAVLSEEVAVSIGSGAATLPMGVGAVVLGQRLEPRIRELSTRHPCRGGFGRCPPCDDTPQPAVDTLRRYSCGYYNPN